MTDTTTGEQTTEQTGSAGEQSGEQTSDKSFTQADVDRIVAERLARANRQFADYDDIKAKAERVDEMESAQASAIEAAVAEAVEKATAELTAKHAAERIGDKIEVAAAGKFADIEDARLRLGSRASEFVSESGDIDMDKIAAALDEVLDKHPHLRAEQPKPPSASRAGIGVTGDAAPAANVKPGLDRLAHAYSQHG